MTVRILTGDCRELMSAMPEQSVHCCVTSPPYFGLRDYGHDGQIGLESSPDEYVAKLVDVFREVRRVLRDDGTLWLNLGDSYATSAGATADRRGRSGNLSNGGINGVAVPAQRARPVADLKPKDLIGIPWMVAFALRADGWYLRQDIIWAKPNPMPESVEDRCTKSHEHIFLLTKSPTYYCDMDAIAEDVAPSTVERLSQPTLDLQHGSDRVPGKTNGAMKAVGRRNSFARMTKDSAGEHGQKPQFREDREAIAYEGTRNKRDVWTVTTKPFREAHFATFPPDLIEPCILAGCPAGGTVLDPFGGAGTTGLVADRHQRDAVLCELNPEYVEIARRRIFSDAPLLTEFVEA